jgi:hypothetical protein
MYLPVCISQALKAAVTGLLSPDPGQRWGLDELLKATDLLPDSLLLDMATEMPALGADMRLLLVSEVCSHVMCGVA